MDEKFLQLRIKYQSTFPQKLAEIKSAREQENVPGLHSLLHKLTGSSGGYGFMELSSLCAEVANITRSNNSPDFSHIDTLLEEIYSILESKGISH